MPFIGAIVWIIILAILLGWTKIAAWLILSLLLVLIFRAPIGLLLGLIFGLFFVGRDDS